MRERAHERKARESAEEGKKLVDRWNRLYPVGQPVIVVEDDGRETETTTTTPAWLMGGHTPVVTRADRAGGYLLTRFCALPGPAKGSEP
jgi:hypothetical protein